MVLTIAGIGEEARSIEVQCRFIGGMAELEIAGLPPDAVTESRKRVQAGLAGLGLSLPPQRIAVTLSPVDLIKDGRHYDLPIALAVLARVGLIDAGELAKWVAVGELAPDGRIDASPGVVRAAASFARASELGLICPGGSEEAEAYAAKSVATLSEASLVGVLGRLRRSQRLSTVEARTDGVGVTADPARKRTRAGEGGAARRTGESVWQRAVDQVRGVPFLAMLRRPHQERGRAGPAENGGSPPTPGHASPLTYPLREPARAASVVREVARPIEERADWRREIADDCRPTESSRRNDRREPDPNFHGIGHRSRLRARLIEGGVEALADYEVLEFILFGARRRGDTKPLAKTLIQRFGSLPAVLNADPVALMRVPGIGSASVGVIKIAAVAAKRMARAQLREQPLLSSWDALIDYLAIDMAHLTRERVRVLYLDLNNRLLKDEHISEGTIDEATVHPREVIHHALDAGATALILVHNHPSGSVEPSRADIQLTNRIAEAGRLVGITVHDHVIVGREGHVSLRAKGLI